jgi:hypothetical protein
MAFSGSDDCPAWPEDLTVREGQTKRLREPDQKAQSPSCGTPSESPRFLSTQIFGMNHLNNIHK